VRTYYILKACRLSANRGVSQMSGSKPHSVSFSLKIAKILLIVKAAMALIASLCTILRLNLHKTLWTRCGIPIFFGFLLSASKRGWITDNTGRYRDVL